MDNPSSASNVCRGLLKCCCKNCYERGDNCKCCKVGLILSALCSCGCVLIVISFSFSSQGKDCLTVVQPQQPAVTWLSFINPRAPTPIPKASTPPAMSSLSTTIFMTTASLVKDSCLAQNTLPEASVLELLLCRWQHWLNGRHFECCLKTEQPRSACVRICLVHTTDQLPNLALVARNARVCNIRGTLVKEELTKRVNRLIEPSTQRME